MHGAIDLREPPKELPPLSFELTPDEAMKAAVWQLELETQRNERTAHQRKQG